jgi:hydroxymethylpyrimidine/phosphomethylpyrimidine kinase
MLFSRPLIEAVAVALTSQDGGRRPALVVDPVMVATSGDPLLQRSAVRAFEQRLFPLAEVITPNLDEAAVLLGREVRSARELEPAAAELRDRYGCAVLLKGGHLRGKTAVDVLHVFRGHCFRHCSREFSAGCGGRSQGVREQGHRAAVPLGSWRSAD